MLRSMNVRKAQAMLLFERSTVSTGINKLRDLIVVYNYKVYFVQHTIFTAMYQDLDATVLTEHKQCIGFFYKACMATFKVGTFAAHLESLQIDGFRNLIVAPALQTHFDG